MSTAELVLDIFTIAAPIAAALAIGVLLFHDRAARRDADRRRLFFEGGDWGNPPRAKP